MVWWAIRSSAVLIVNATRKEGAIRDRGMLKNFYARFEEGTIEAICDDHADPESLARQIAEGLDQGRFRVA